MKNSAYLSVYIDIVVLRVFTSVKYKKEEEEEKGKEVNVLFIPYSLRS